MQTAHYMSIKLVYILVTDQISFIPDNIINMSKIISIARPNKTTYNKCIGRKITDTLNINDITNIKNINSKITQLMNPHEMTCNEIINLINNIDLMNFIRLRELCYDIFIYHLDIYECVWYILKNVIDNNILKSNHLHNILVKTFVFFKYYNNNYRPIYHLENYILYLISEIHELK